MSGRPVDTEFDPERVVVRDKRRLDPQTGAVKEQPSVTEQTGVAGGAAADDAAFAAPTEATDTPTDTPADAAAGAGDGGSGDGADETAAPADPVAELTETLQRVQAEYANYRKRVERDRLAMVEQATATLLGQLVPLLDDVERARQHDDLSGAFKTVGEGLEAVAEKFGLERYGAPGEPFDPMVHEAVMQAEPDEAFTVATCAQVFRPGFRVGGKVLRPAQVAVAEPAA